MAIRSFLSCLILILLSLCTLRVHPSRATAADLTIALEEAPGPLDPHRMSWSQDLHTGMALWEGLYTFDPRTSAAIPGSAATVEISDDRLTYTFHLREGVRWSNGDPLVSGDFVFAWRRLLEDPGPYSYLLHYIQGARRYSEQFASEPDQARWDTVGIRAPDPATVVVTLANPTPFFLEIAAFAPMFPLHERSMSPYRKIDPATKRARFDPEFADRVSLVVNGPYHVTEYSEELGWTLRKNPHYWDSKAVATESIEVRFYSDSEQALDDYESRRVQCYLNPSGSGIAELRARGRTDLRNARSLGTTFLALNCRPKLHTGEVNPLADARVRQALAMAINRNNLVGRVRQDLAMQFVPPSFPGYRRVPGIGMNLGQANRLLTQAGHGQTRLPSLMFLEDITKAGTGKALSNELRTNLRIAVDIERVSPAEYRRRMDAGEFQIASYTWNGDYNDVSTFLDRCRSDSINNREGWNNADFDRTLDQASREADRSRRLRLLSDAEHILLNQAPLIPLYFPIESSLIRPNVRGAAPTPAGVVMFKGVTVGR